MTAEMIMTPFNIAFAICGVIGIAFSAYQHFKNPQIKIDKKQALSEQESHATDTLFEKQLEWEKIANAKQFALLDTRVDKAFTLAQNHIHTVDKKVDTLIGTVNTMGNEITKLSTIIDERIPKK